MTSQTWLTPEDFVGTIGHQWWHYVVVVVPYEWFFFLWLIV